MEQWVPSRLSKKHIDCALKALDHVMNYTTVVSIGDYSLYVETRSKLYTMHVIARDMELRAEIEMEEV